MIYTSLNEGIEKKLQSLREQMDQAVKEGRIKLYRPTTLFDIEPEWKYLYDLKCPLCANKLLFPRSKSIAMCKGKRHLNKKPFVIKNETLDRLGIKKV